MAGVEREIRTAIIDNNADQFDMTVSVKWTELRSSTAASRLAIDAFEEANEEFEDDNGRPMNGEERSQFLSTKQAEFLAKFNAYAARVSPNLKRCKETKYDVALKRGGNEVATLDRELSEDIWLGQGG